MLIRIKNIGIWVITGAFIILAATFVTLGILIVLWSPAILIGLLALLLHVFFPTLGWMLCAGLALLISSIICSPYA